MFLRSLRSAALCALLLGWHVALLALFLNPHLQARAEVGALLRSLVLPYSLAGFAAFAALCVVLTLIRGVRPLPRPLIESLPWFSTLSFLATATAAGLDGFNLAYHRLSIPVVFVSGLLTCAVAVAVCALILLAAIVDSWLFAGRARGAAAALVVLAAGGAAIAPLLCLPHPSPPPPPVPVAAEHVAPPRRVFVLAFDAVAPDMLERAIAHGRGAALAQLMREGAYMPLTTIRPTESLPVWSSVWTGRLPRDHGVKSGYWYSLRGSESRYELLPKGIFISRLEQAGFATLHAIDSHNLRAKALWHVLQEHGVATGIVRLPGTHPAAPMSPFVVSDRFYESSGVSASQALYPPLLQETVASHVVRPDQVDAAVLEHFLADPDADPGAPWRRELVDEALAPDMTYESIGSVLQASLDPSFYALYLRGPDIIGHTFLRYAEPESFGNVPAGEVRRFGGVIDGYIDFASEAAGRLMARTRPGDVVVVVSGFGLTPMRPWRRAMNGFTGAPRDGATHEWGPPGFLIAWGRPIAAGSASPAASVLDIAPTLLYLMGVPVARDLDGRVLVDILEDGFARRHPITYVPTYEGAAAK